MPALSLRLKPTIQYLDLLGGKVATILGLSLALDGRGDWRKSECLAAAEQDERQRHDRGDVGKGAQMSHLTIEANRRCRGGAERE